MADQDQVANVLSIRRNFERERILDRPHRSDRVDGGAYAAEALGKDPALTCVAPAQDGFEAAPHGTTRPCFVHHAAVYLDIDAQMSFDAGDGINRDAGHQAPPSNAEACVRGIAAGVAVRRFQPKGRNAWSQVLASPGNTAK